MSWERALQNMQQQIGSAHSKINALGQQVQAQQNNGGQNAALQQEIARMKVEMKGFADSLSRVTANASGDPHDVRYVEQIPGRRFPFDLMVRIPIGANVTAEQQAAVTISQDGPFVAVARFATFQSAHQFSVEDPNTQAISSFQGRSYGRFRPIHSAWDLNDGQAGYQPVVGGALPGTGAPIFASPSNHSSFRTMEFDGMIKFQNQGAGWPRQNIETPSAFYSTEINSPFSLGSLDFFERGEVLEWRVTPLHVNNPPAGNAQGFAAGGFYPFLASQYDVQEGIVDELIQDQETDPVTRLPDGILTIGLHGFRIIQPPGQVSLT